MIRSHATTVTSASVLRIVPEDDSATSLVASTQMSKLIVRWDHHHAADPGSTADWASGDLGGQSCATSIAMRKLLFIVTMAIALGALAPAAAPAWAAPDRDQVTGTGTLGQFGDPTAHVNAIQTAAGLKGGFSIAYPDGSFAAGSATCLLVTGTTAYLTGQITRSGGPRQQTNDWQPGSFLIIGVVDNGEPGTAGPDLLNFSPGFATDPGCGPNPAATPVFPITAGNYDVFGAS